MKIVAIIPNREEFLACEVLKGLHRRGVELIPSSPLSNIRNAYARCSPISIGAEDIPDTKDYTDDEIIEHAKSADYIFVFWGKFASPYDATPGGKMYLLDKINEPDKTVFIDGSEWSYTGHMVSGQVRKDKLDCSKGMPWIWQEMRDRVKWYFKRETFPEDVVEHGIIPCPYPFRIEDKQQLKVRDISLLCAFGQTSTGLRAEVEEACHTISHSLPVIVGSQPGGRVNYLDLISRSHMIVDAWGGGDCNVRRSEIHMNSVASIMQEWNILEPYPFIDGENVIFYNTVEEFKEKADFYLKNLDKLIEIGENGYKHGMEYHITEKRVQYIFDIINEEITWKHD